MSKIPPVTREEHFLARIAGDPTALVLEPQTRLEHFLQKIIDNGGPSPGSGLSTDVKDALLACFAHVAWTNEHGQDYYDALESALYPPADLVSISAVYTQSGTVYDTDSLDSLKDDLIVTATYQGGTSAVIPSADYTLSGTLTAGTSTITVTYREKTTTFSVTVTAAPTLTGITAVYTQSGTVYDTDSLDSLKADLVVTAFYQGGGSKTVTDYALSGTLEVGTSTITVSYGGKTATFDVTVTHSLYWKILNIEQDFIDGGLMDVAPYENTARTDRCSYAAFDLLISPDYSYTFEFGTGVRMGVPWYTSEVFQLVQNNQSVESVKTDAGWKSNGYSFTPGNDGACMRITFEKNKTDVLSAGITEVKITRTAVNAGG